MINEIKTPEIFKYGSTWLRADFHLHTKVDKEFCFDGEKNNFVNNYVAALKSQNIRVGAITNHNKFDIDEFKALRKTARKEEIFLLPGVELSVNDGANGIHTLVIFNDDWFKDGSDYINQFLNVAFEGKNPNQYEQNNGRSSLDLLTTLKKLEGYYKDFFVVFAHVEQSSGLWHELNGGRLQEFGQDETFRRNTLGFQKVRTHDKPDEVCRIKIQDWLGDWYPAEVEGSDCKSIEEIGKGQKCFLKLGDFSYDSVKFALMDKDNRVSSKPINYKHSYIRSIRFTGGTLSGQELHFSPELNTLIGIRGSGKSSIVEALRYVLNIPIRKDSDKEYKKKLVGFTLGSGGEVEIDAIDRHRQLYTIRHICEEEYSEVFIDGKLQPGVSICETVLHYPRYYGQKDLSITGEGFEKDFVNKLLGSKLIDIRRNISIQKEKVMKAVSRLIKVSNARDSIGEQKKIKQDTEHQLKVYADYGFEDKLQKQLDFDSDTRTIEKGIQLTHNFVTNLEGLLAQHEDDLRNLKDYQSTHNKDLFVNFYKKYDFYITFVEHVKKWLVEEKDIKNSLSAFQNELSTIREGMDKEFAENKRKLSKELKSSDTQNISSDEFLKLNKKLDDTNQLISELKNQDDQKNSLQDQLLVELQKLNEFWLEEFTMIKTELDKVSSGKSSISITSGYKEDKTAFLSFMKDMFKGSGIRETTYQGIVEQYLDFVSIYKDFENAKKYFGSNPHVLSDLFKENLKTLLTYQTPNKFTILYRGKELQHHSLGQRSSALILFVLSQEDNDVIIVDQPEDDLDNQTIYEDVIKLICQIKPKVQFIFATHNPNIPVLGDAEQVLACSFTEDKVTVCAGSVDNPCTQKTIVNIMEGGKEAFDRRKEIYRIWKS